MFCRQCGTRNKESVKFCERCGKEMIRPGKHSLQNNPQHGNIQQRNPQHGNIQQRKPQQGNPQHRNPQQRDIQPKEKNRRKPLMILIAVLLLANIIVVGWVFVGHQTTRAFNDAMEEGNRYLLAENLEQAEAHFLRAIEVRPREVEPYLQLADIYMTWDEPEEAIAILEQGLEAVSEADRPVLEEALDEVYEVIGREPLENGYEVEVEEEDVPRFRVEWVLEPTIEADDINYVPVAWYWCDNYFINDTYRQYTSTFAAIRRGDTFGLIGNDGHILGEGLIYNNVSHIHGWTPDGSFSGRTYVLSFIDPPDLGPGPSLPHHVLVNGQFEIGFPPSGTGAWHRFYYYNGLRLATMNTMEDLPVGRVPNHPFPVQGTGRIITQSVGREEWNSAWYGVFYQGQMQTDFLYTQMGSYSEGLLAVEQNGRWGYINRFGEVIIPIEFDSSFIMISQGSVGLQGNLAYAASEGFVPLVRDGVWEMRTITNEQVIEPGAFEAIRPIIDGRSWVRYNGLWGVIEIIENDDPRSTETEEDGEVELDLYDLYREVFERYQGMPNLRYGFYDIDGNGIPELLLYSFEQIWAAADPTLGITHIFTLNNGQVVRLFARSEGVWCDGVRIEVGAGLGAYVYSTGYIKERLTMNIRHNEYRIYRISQAEPSLIHVGTISTGTTGGNAWYFYNNESITEGEYNAIMARYTNKDPALREHAWSSWESNVNIQWRPMP